MVSAIWWEEKQEAVGTLPPAGKIAVPGLLVLIFALLLAAPVLAQPLPMAATGVGEDGFSPVYLEESTPGVEIGGRASTEIQYRKESRRSDSAPLFQYLQLNLRHFDEEVEEKYAVHAYGRLGTDLRNEDDWADSRLYYAYYQKQDLFDKIDFRLGRQFISVTAGASLLDGLTLDYRPGGPLSPFTFTVFGGGDVAFYTSYSAKDTLMGGEIRGRFRDETLVAGLSYVQRREDSDKATELIGADFDYGFRKMVNLYGEIQYDYLGDRVSYGLIGTNYHRSDRWGLRTEYLYSLPVFSATSIYSVFAVSKYQEAMAELNYYHGGGRRSFIRYSREIYEDFRDADVLEAGLEQIRLNRFSGYLSGVWRYAGDGGQDMHGVRARLAWLFTPHVQGGIGTEMDVLQRRLDEFEDDTLSSRFWADLTARLTRDLDLQARLERAQSSGYWGYHNRATLRLNLTF
ncbi:conserved hypothetical protein [Desulfurivibrio alkaliphilus AHT 2]|uniref:PEP-CTERM system associated protein n=1 Tax=Desulfurivibrio alkaliphilus (strain DSM 19089 / UNIQEM U267 / AHT2) TaxID=589865 RepID=D6Z6U8_DESAT|nr:conserved hypothetical protein [Desulfurivibrio alkaliphilus AHT 2]